MPTVQLSIPGTCRSDKKARAPKLSESALQQQVRQTLGNLGYASAEVGASRQQVTCPCCAQKFFPEGWQGNTPGVPDLLLFRYATTFPPIAALVELKATEKAPIRPAQKLLADAGRSQVAHSIEGVIRAVIHVEESMTRYKTPDSKMQQLEQFLEMNKGRI